MNDRQLVLEREFDAPRELVWEAWTSPEHLPKWFGPKGFRCEVREIDIRPGGVFRFLYLGPEGVTFDNRMQFIELTKPERIHYRHDSDKDDDPAAFMVTILLTAVGGRTKLTMTSTFASAAQVEKVKGFGAVEKGYETLEKLAAHLAALAKKK